MTTPSQGPDDADRRDRAAIWVVRHDRGLSPAEQSEFDQWLQADPANAAAWRRSHGVWGRFSGFTPEKPAAVVPIAGHGRKSAIRWAGGLAAAAALAILGYIGLQFMPEPAEPAATVAMSAPAEFPQTRVLPDGTLARLNVGALLVEAYSDKERRVQLLQGEAYFAVTRDTSRRFVVDAHGVEVEAVGTAFGVSLETATVDVLVTEGTVKVTAPVESTEPSPLVTAGHRAVVTRQAAAEPAVVVTEVDIVEVNRGNSWRGGLLRLGGSTLAELAREFEAQTGRKLVFSDPDLASLRVGGRYPGNDIDGFVRVLQEHYGVQVIVEADGTLVLGRAR